MDRAHPKNQMLAEIHIAGLETLRKKSKEMLSAWVATRGNEGIEDLEKLW